MTLERLFRAAVESRVAKHVGMSDYDDDFESHTDWEEVERIASGGHFEYYERLSTWVIDYYGKDLDAYHADLLAADAIQIAIDWANDYI